MKFRLQEGNGEAKYRIGVEDNGTAMGLSHEEMLVSLSEYKHLKYKVNCNRNSMLDCIFTESRRCSYSDGRRL
jgi:GTPase